MPTEIDLYKDDLATVPDSELYAAVESFTRIASSPADRAQEGYLLDFKATWSDSALKTVAAFANTFGGLLLVGVSENGGRADQIVGVPSSRQELKTSIASAVASNISPTPPYEIRDVAFPDGSGLHLCIVRVRKGNSLFLFTKKGEQPVYVRNEDESRPADAARLQALLATRAPQGRPPIGTSQPSLTTQLLFVTRAQAPASAGPEAQALAYAHRTRSPTFLQMHLTPSEPLTVRLDLTIEQRLLSIIRVNYPDLAGNVDDPGRTIGAKFVEGRSRDSYHITYSEISRDYEIRWIVDSTGALYFETQTRCPVQQRDFETEVWSLADMMTNLNCTIATAHEFWDFLNYPGEAEIHAELRIESLPLLERTGGSQSVYSSAFYEKSSHRKRVRPLPTDLLTKALKQGTRATAGTNLTYATRWRSRSEPVALVTNQLLRDLGHAANLADLRSLLP